LATKEELRQHTFANLAFLCHKVAECRDAGTETVNKAQLLRKELLTFARWIAPGKTAKQITAEEESLKKRAVDFLYAEQKYWNWISLSA
jgi:hypothetical protein